MRTYIVDSGLKFDMIFDSPFTITVTLAATYRDFEKELAISDSANRLF